MIRRNDFNWMRDTVIASLVAFVIIVINSLLYDNARLIVIVVGLAGILFSAYELIRCHKKNLFIDSKPSPLARFGPDKIPGYNYNDLLDQLLDMGLSVYCQGREFIDHPYISFNRSGDIPYIVVREDHEYEDMLIIKAVIEYYQKNHS